MTMIYFAPIRSTTLAIVKRWRPSLLVASLCVLLVGCDSASSNTDKDMVSTFASTGSESQNASQSLQDDNARNAELANDDETSEMVEGQSLIASDRSIELSA